MTVKKNNNCIEVYKDEFNSQIFERMMGNLEIGNFDGTNIQHLREKVSDGIVSAKNAGFKHLTCKVDTGNKLVIHTLEQCGFQLMDTVMTYVFDFGRNQLACVKTECKMGDCTEKDLPIIKEIAKIAFKIDRFHSDASLPDELCDKYYEKWIENSFNGFADRVIVAYYHGEAVGFTTAKINHAEPYSQLVLSAVSDKHRGIGVYTGMIFEGVKWFMGQNDIKGLLVGTQIDNLSVQKAWIKLGFTVYESKYVFQTSL